VGSIVPGVMPTSNSSAKPLFCVPPSFTQIDQRSTSRFSATRVFSRPGTFSPAGRITTLPKGVSRVWPVCSGVAATMLATGTSSSSKKISADLS
jgi:hypothetical protein